MTSQGACKRWCYLGNISLELIFSAVQDHLLLSFEEQKRVQYPAIPGICQWILSVKIYTVLNKETKLKSQISEDGMENRLNIDIYRERDVRKCLICN